MVADARLTLHLTCCAAYVRICVMRNLVPFQPSTRLSHQLHFSIVTMIARITNPVACSKVFKDGDLYVLEIGNIYNEVATSIRIRQSAPRDAPNEETAKDLCADLPRPVSGEAPFGLIDSARVLRHTGSINLQGDGNIPAVRKLGPGRETNLTATTNSTSLDVDIVAVLEQNRVVTRVGDIDRTNLRPSRRRYTEDAATAATSLDAVDVDVSSVSAVDLSGFVGETESRVASASAAVVAVYGTDLRVGDLLEEKTAFSDVLADDRADVELIDVPKDMKSAHVLHAVCAVISLPCLNAVRRAAVAGDGTHLDVCVGRSVAVETDTHSFLEVEVDSA